MPDFSYQGLLQAMTPQVPPSQTPLLDGFSAPQPQSNDLVAQMLAKQRLMQGGQTFMPEINPGLTWGGRDKNAVMPDDVQQARFYTQPPEPI